MVTHEMLIEMSCKEYELLRAEVITTVERQYSLANWGVSSVAVIIAAIIGGWQTVSNLPVLMSALLIVILPSTMTSYAISWAHTVTKLNQLGARLYEIEENIACLCDSEIIRNTFNIPKSNEIQPYRYTIGWEHALWTNGINNRIQTTIHIVGLILGVFFLIVIVGNGAYMVRVYIFSPIFVWNFSIILCLFWGGVWFVIFRYLHRRTVDASLPNHCQHKDTATVDR